jgi:hypothetical protein
MIVRRTDRGGATLLLVLVLLAFAAILGALAVRGATGDLQMAASQRASRTSFYCAEGGLNYARPVLAANYGQWNTIFAGGAVTGFTYPVVGDLDGDHVDDFSVTIADNIDEFPTNVPTVDGDLSAILTSTCISSTLSGGASNRTLRQIITYTGQLGTDYRFQAGHSSTHSGNEN